VRPWESGDDGAAVTERASALLEAAAEVARLAGEVAIRHFRTRLAVETKRDGSPVTAADRAAERAAREWIERRFPRDGILGEEFGLVRGDAPRRWMVDPIDGTKTFVRGVPLWGTLVAVAEGETVLAGAAYYPAVGEMLAAAPGSGCWWNGEMSPWDAAALMPIVEEAGGVFTDWGGARTAFGGSAVATNRELAAAARALLATSPGADEETPAEGRDDA
jgi:fructose-1,6-bisphosphatase/inositol monophosphatase family enzyme